MDYYEAFSFSVMNFTFFLISKGSCNDHLFLSVIWPLIFPFVFVFLALDWPNGMLSSYLSREFIIFTLTINVPAQAVGWLANKVDKCVKNLNANRRDSQKFWECISGPSVNHDDA